MIILYGPAQAPFTEKVRRALVYKGYEFELREPESPEDYKRWSPKTGMLPVLDLNGEHVPDSTDILYRIDADRPDPPLLSSDPTVATQQRQLEDWADESFLFYYMQYRRTLESQGTVVPTSGRAAPGGEASERTPSGPLRRLAAWLRAGGTWERPETAILRGLGLRLDDLANFLGARAFFYADRLSMGDLAVYAMLFTMRNEAIPGSSQLVAQRPALVGLMRRIEEATGGVTRAEKARRIGRILDRLYPDARAPLRHEDAFTLLVAVVLSAQCTDERVNRVTPALFAAASTPQEMARLGARRILPLIRSCGLAPSKAKALAGLSRQLVAEHGGRVPDDLAALEALPGVGHKTASVVVNQAFGRPAFAIDTHIHRLASRWGLSRARNVAETERDLKRLFVPEEWGRRHLEMIYFGREHCPARGHDLASCPICGWAASKTRIARESRGVRS